MNGLQHTVLLPINPRDATRSGIPPSKKDDTVAAHPCNKIKGLLSKAFPALARVTICLMCTNRQACIEQQHAAFRPRREQTTLIRRRLEGWIIILNALVDVCQRRGGGRWRTHRECQSMSLIVIVVGILTDHNSLHFM